jgi:hypothetical protein
MRWDRVLEKWKRVFCTLQRAVGELTRSGYGALYG